MIPLSRRTAGLVTQIFEPGDAEKAARLLETECAETLPLVHSPNPEGLERIRFAALRTCEGDLETLKAMVVLAQTDWRDLLMAAGFGESIDAHNQWANRRLGEG